MYNKITNPETGRQVSIYGKRGQMVLRKYLTIIQQTVGGGDSDDQKDILSMAAYNGDMEVVRLALSKTAKVDDALDNNGSTPLFIAAYNGDTEELIYLYR